MAESLLLVDDEEGVREGLAEYLAMQGFDITEAAGEAEAWDLAQARPPQVVVSDMNLGKESGLSLLRKFKQAPPSGVEPFCILMTGYGTLDTAVEALRSGVDDLLTKPFSLQELGLSLDKARRLRPGDGAGENLGGIPAREPTYDLPARWIPDAARAQALRLGATVVDAGSVLATHISETLRQNLHRLISRREVTQMVDQLRKRSPSLVEEVTPALLSLGEVQRVMSLLLEDGVMLRDLAAFFEALSLAARDGKEPERLAEACRLALARLTLSQISGMDRVVKAVGLDPKLEEMMENAEKAPPTPERALKIRTRLQDALRHWLADAPRAVLLTSPKARVALARLCEGLEPKPLILSTRE
ncbi:MAG TPA: FHIPEP family type III secretion protein, partial [bacterium]|nr:FHIPEP family type III secretion protein [bacterium]